MTLVQLPTRLGPIAVRRHGAGGPAVLLWHSLYVDGQSWDAIVPELGRGRSVIVVDGPGHGASPGPGRRFTLDECADAAVEVLDALGVDEVDWIGNAWGGHVGVVLAARPRTRVRSLVAMCSPMQALARGDRLRGGALVGLLALAGVRPFLVRAVCGVLLLPEVRAARPELEEAIVAAMRRPTRRALVDTLRSAMLGRPSLVERLGDVEVPTLFVTTPANALWPPSLARAHAARLPAGRFDVLHGARHLPPMEAPEKTAALLTGWLATRSAA